MIDEERRGARSRAGGGVALVLAALVVGRLVYNRVLDGDLPDIDAPGWLRWIGPALGAAKLLWLAGLGLLVVLAAVGEWSRRRRDGGGR